MSQKYPRENAGTLGDPLRQHRLPIFQMHKLRLGARKRLLGPQARSLPRPRPASKVGLTTFLGLSGGGQAGTSEGKAGDQNWEGRGGAGEGGART